MKAEAAVCAVDGETVLWLRDGLLPDRLVLLLAAVLGPVGACLSSWPPPSLC